MNLISPQLLFGLAFAAIPVLLHLLMKSKPKKVLFPALRLIQMRKKTNSRRMRLKHIWLLLLRTLLLAGLVIAIARPSLPAANYGLSWTEVATLAGILLVSAGVYQGLKRRWNQQRIASHDLRYKTTVLRGGTGTAIAVLIALLVGWPYGNRIAAELSGQPASTTAQDVPVAAVFLFDNSLSMQYRLENKTRLEAAREIATAHLGTLPPGSRVAIADVGGSRDIVFQGDLISAGARIDALKSEPGTVELNDRLLVAIDLHADDRERVQEERGLSKDDDQYVREIYVLSDMARTAWRTGTANLRQKLEGMPWVHTYLIDVSVEEPINCGITDVRLSRQSLTRGSTLNIDATLVSDGIDGLRTVEVHINDKGGEPVRQDTRTIKVEPGVGGRIKFPIVTPESRFVQGEVRLVSSDPLAIDDVRYFTVGVNSPPRVLVIGENLEEADNLLTALAPDILKKQNRAEHIETYRSVREVTEADINANEIVCLVNLRGPSPELWSKLQTFVEAGGGLAVFLGNSDIDATAYNTEEAQQLLPAELLAPVKFFKGPFIVDLQNDQHALFRRILDSNDERAEFASVFYERAWSVEATEESRVLATYNNERQMPAWLERPVGKGRAVLFSNGVDNIGDDGKPWSDFVTTWSFMRVTSELMHYLGHYTDGRFNWISGQSAIVRFDRGRVQDQYLLRKPSLQQLPGQVPQQEDFVVLSDVSTVGHYRFSSGRGEDAFVSGFSVNSDDFESKFEPIKDAELTTLLGEGRYSKARHIEELDRAVQNSRLGQEIFPLLMILVVIFFVGEHFVANYFYDDGTSAVTDATPRTKVAT